MNHQNRLNVYHSLINLIVIAALLAASLAVSLATPQSVRAADPPPSAWVWGYTGYGPTVATQISSTPVQVTELSSVVAIDGSTAHTLIVKSDGTVWAFGNNTYWQLGDGTTNSSTIPVQVKGPGGVGYLSSITAVATGWYHNLALKSDGTVWAWGYNSDGQLGIAVRDSGSSTPVQVKAPAGAGFLTDVVAVAAERFWSLALKSDGTVWAWGANYEAGVGDNTTGTRSRPVQVKGTGGVGFLTDVTAIAAGDTLAIARKTDGSVWTWGSNYYGQAGDGTMATSGANSRKLVPVQVKGPGGVGFLGDVVAVGTGQYHALAAKSDGTVWAWGDDAAGQLGNGTNPASITPVQVLGPDGTGFLTGITAVSGSNAVAYREYAHSVALAQDGSVWTWGWNNYGQLGDSTKTLRTTPIKVVGTGGVGYLGGATMAVASHNATLAVAPAPTSPAIKVVKSSTTTAITAANQVVPYTFSVTNIGNVTLTGITVSDPNCTAAISGPAGDTNTNSQLDLTETWTYTCNHTVTQAELDTGGKLSNTVTADSTESAPATATLDIPITQSPAISLTKSANPTTYNAVNQSINYSYVIKNTGNVTLSGPFAVTDDKATVTCTQPADAALSPNEEMTCTASYSITQTDLDNGSVINKATATNGTETSNEATATITADKKPALGLVKTASPATYDTPNQTISYGYVIKNTGNVTLSGPFAVTDDKATVTCTQPADAALSPNEEMTCTASYSITQTDLDNGSVINKATATNGTEASNEATATITADKKPTLSLVKTASPATYDTPNQTISYGYVIKNTGNVTLSGPFAVTDDKATVTCTQPADAALSPNEEITCTASYSITQTDLDNGSVINKATASGGGANSNEATATIAAVQTRALAIEKSAQETTYAKAGDFIHYSYLVTNAGNVTLRDPITVSDDKAADESCPALPAGGLAPGQSITCTASHAVAQADLDAGSLTNVASATDGTTTSPIDTVTVSATQRPALELAKSASPATYNRAGQTINYSYVLKNTGNVTLSGPFTVTDDKAAVTCPAAVTSLAPGDTLTCTATYTIMQADLDAGSITNIAKGRAFFGTTPVDSNEDTKTVTADKKPALTIVKTATPGTYDAVGQAISYSYLVTNNGNVTLYNISVVDDKASVTCPSTAAGLAPAGTITCSSSYSITQVDLDAGSVTNSAYATDGTTNSTPDSETVNALQQGGLGLTKSASPTNYSKVGDAVSYSYVVINTGNVTLAGPFTVNDDKVGAVSCPAGSLAPNATVTCTASYTIMQADLDAGSITNHATATDGTLISNPAQATVTAVQTRALAIEKSAQETTYAKAGDVIHYSYLVTNAGNVTLRDPITISDDKAADESCPALPADGLAPGQSITCTASYVVTQADLDAGSLTNVASATDGTITSPIDTVTIPATQRPALELAKSASPATYNRAGQTINYSYALKNTGNVTLSGPFAVTDDKVTVTCPAAVTSLAPDDTLACMATYTIMQADLAAGKVTNKATATASFSGNTITSNEATATVNAIQTPALSLIKSANPTIYSYPGQVIIYTYVVKNTGNVTLSGPFNITDNKLGSFQCGTATSLAPDASITCTKSYTIKATDIGNLTDSNTKTTTATDRRESQTRPLCPQPKSITNTARATGKFGNATVTSNQATVTVTQVASTSKITATATSCQMYKDGTAWDYTTAYYNESRGKIGSVAPGVILYYSTITAPASTFTLSADQFNNSGSPKWPPMGTAQVILWNKNCVKFPTVTTTADPLTGKVTLNVTGATAGATYFLSVKYNPNSLTGTVVRKPYPTVSYTFVTSLNGAALIPSWDSIAVKPK